VGFSSADIQKSMHHKSPYSHLIYIQSTESDLRAKMKLFYDKTKDRSLS
jgi:hypothetical protein